MVLTVEILTWTRQGEVLPEMREGSRILCQGHLMAPAHHETAHSALLVTGQQPDPVALDPLEDERVRRILFQDLRMVLLDHRPESPLALPAATKERMTRVAADHFLEAPMCPLVTLLWTADEVQVFRTVSMCLLAMTVTRRDACQEGLGLPTPIITLLMT